MRHLLLSSLLLVSLGLPSTAHARWYGWHNSCHPSSLTLCVSVMLQTVPTSDGGTWLLIQSLNNAYDETGPAMFGGPAGRIFSPSLVGWECLSYPCDSGFHVWYDNVSPWLAGVFPPSFGSGWAHYAFHVPIVVKQTDLTGHYVEMYTGWGNGYDDMLTWEWYLTAPSYIIVSEPSAVLLLGTGLLALGLMAWRRRESQV